jgi:tetratricopeptide (TPR) repeat protein
LKNKSIYISYAWGDLPESEENVVVESLYKALTDFGFEVVIDKNSLDYRQSLPRFFEIIGAGGIVIPIIGNKYLTRPNCLIEAANMVIRGDINERIYPLVLTNNYDVYDSTKRGIIVSNLKEYWKEKEAILTEAVDFNDELEHSFIPIREDLGLVSQIIATISKFIDHVGNSKQFNLDYALKNNFRDFIDYIILQTKEIVERPFYEKPPGEYFGRKDDIEFVDGFLKDETKHFLLLYGIGGIGKTHLLSICLDKFNYTKKFFWVKGDDTYDLRKLFESCSLRYPKELESKEIDELAGVKKIYSHFLNEFTNNNLFLIIDDYYEIIDPFVRELLPLLVSLPSGKLLIISRETPKNIVGLSVYDYEVSALGKEDFLKAMNAFIIQKKSKIFTGDELEKIFDKAQGYPLGGRLIINLADANSDIPIDDILKDIVKFDAEEDPEGKEFSGRLLDNIFKRGNPLEIRILTEFSALYGFSTMDIIRQLPSFKMAEFSTLVRRRRFITSDRTGRYSSHAMIRDYAYDRLEDKENTHRILGSYFETKLTEKKEADWNLIESAIQHYSHVNEIELKDFGRKIQAQFGLNNVMSLIDENAKNTIRNLKSMLTIEPENIYYLHRLGMTYRLIGNINESVNTYVDALILEPDNVRVLNELGISYRERKRPGDIDLAIATFEKIYSLSPKDLKALNELGISYRERKKPGDIDLAIATFIKANEVDPKHLPSLNELGISYRERKRPGDIDLAIATFEKIYSLSPKDLKALNELGISYRERKRPGDIDLAIATFEKAIAIEPKALPSLNELGISYRERKKPGDIDLAIATFEKAIAIEPDNVRVLTEIGKSYSYKKDLKNSILFCEKAIKIDPFNMQSYTILYKSYLYSNHLSDAINIVKRGLKVNPKDKILLKIKEELISSNRWVE